MAATVVPFQLASTLRSPASLVLPKHFPGPVQPEKVGANGFAYRPTLPGALPFPSLRFTAKFYSTFCSKFQPKAILLRQV